MILYEFKCTNCGYRFDEFQSHKQPHVSKCPRCSQMAKRVYTPVYFNFDFWYGWDEGLGEYCDTKSDRERYMREKKLERIRD